MVQKQKLNTIAQESMLMLMNEKQDKKIYTPFYVLRLNGFTMFPFANSPFCPIHTSSFSALLSLISVVIPPVL